MDVEVTRAAFENAGLIIENSEVLSEHAREFGRLREDLSAMQEALSRVSSSATPPIAVYQTIAEGGR